MELFHIMEQTLEQNKTFIRNHFEEFVNRKNSAIAYQNFASNFIDREEPFVGLASPELVKQTMDKAYVKYPICTLRLRTRLLRVTRLWCGVCGAEPMHLRERRWSLRALCFGD